MDQEAFYQEVGRRIRDARTRRKPPVTQEGLAAVVSLTRTSITNIEKGRQKFLLHTLADIAGALHMQTSELLPESEGPLVDNLKTALKNHSSVEKEWIRSTVSASQKGKAADGA